MSSPPTWVPLVVLGVVAASTVWRWAELRARTKTNAFVAPADSVLEWLFAIVLAATTAFAVAYAVRRSITDDLENLAALEQPGI